MQKKIELFTPDNLLSQIIARDPAIDNVVWLSKMQLSAKTIESMFILAVTKGELNAIKCLSSIYPANFGSNKLIGLAAKNNQLEVLKFLCSLPQVDPADSDNDPITWAAVNGHLDIVKFLSTLPCIINSGGNLEAFCTAVDTNQLEIVKFLSTAPGVDPAATNNHKAIRWGIKHGKDMMDFLTTLPCFDPFAKTINLQKKKELVALFTELHLENALVKYQIKANTHLGFLFFNKASNMDCLISDVKKIIVKNALEIDQEIDSSKLACIPRASL